MKLMSPVWIAVVLAAVLFQMGCSSSTKGAKQVSVDGNIITEAEARAEGAEQFEALELQALRDKAEYARNERKILEKAFDKLIDDKLVDLEAEKRGISKEELLETEIEQKVQEPSDEEVDDFYEMNKSQIAGSKEEMAPRIREYMKGQQEKKVREDFYARLKEDHKVVRSLDYLRFDVDAPGRPARGPVGAPVQLVEFSDFQCSYCRAFSKTLKQVVEKYGDKVRLVFRQFPLRSIHPDAQRAAEASLCAADQGRFWEMHDLMFEDSMNLEEADILKKAEQIGLDVTAFQDCLTSGLHTSQVQEDIHAGAVAGVGGTPTLFINGRYFNGDIPFDSVAKVIDEELSLK